MEITKLFEIIAGYLNFAIDLTVLRGVDKYKRLGSIDPQLVSYFVAGVVMAYVIASMQRLPGYESKIPGGKSSELSVGSGDEGAVLKVKNERDTSAEQKDMASFVLLSILGAFVFHAVLIIYHTVRPSVAIWNVKDTLNMLGPFGIMAVIGVGLAISVLLRSPARAASVNVAPADADAVAQRADPFARDGSGDRGEREVSNRENELSV